jgi:hypothetical protein
MTDNQAILSWAEDPAKEYIPAMYVVCMMMLFCTSMVDSYSYYSPLTSFYPTINLLLSLMFGGLGAAIIHTGFFAIWCAPVLTGENRIPVRSAVVLLIMTLLTMFYFTVEWLAGTSDKWVGLACINGGFIFVLTGLWFWVRKQGGIVLYFVFHLLMFAWVRFAFLPYSGELP